MATALVVLGVVSVLLLASFLFPVHPALVSQGGPVPLYKDTADGSSNPIFIIFVCGAIMAMLACAVVAIVKVFQRDAPTFEERPVEEQQRLHQAGDVLHLGLKGAPAVANSVATREGRRAGREATRRSKAARREH